MPAPQAVEAEDKDLPLREDIRLLGRILGDTVREQAGAAVFDTVEWATAAERDVVRAFVSILHRFRFFAVPDAETLPELLKASLSDETVNKV